MEVVLDRPLIVIFAVSVAALLAASEFGHYLGLRDFGEADVTTLEASVLGLLALMISFDRRRWRLPVYMMALLVAAVILLIQDIDRPSAGFVAVSQRPMIDTANSIANYSVDFEKNAPQR